MGHSDHRQVVNGDAGLIREGAGESCRNILACGNNECVVTGFSTIESIVVSIIGDLIVVDLPCIGVSVSSVNFDSGGFVQTYLVIAEVDVKIRKVMNLNGEGVRSVLTAVSVGYVHHILASIAGGVSGASLVQNNVGVHPLDSRSIGGYGEVEDTVGADVGQVVVFNQSDGRQRVHCNGERVRGLSTALVVSYVHHILAGFGGAIGGGVGQSSQFCVVFHPLDRCAVGAYREVESTVGADGGQVVVFRERDIRQRVHLDGVGSRVLAAEVVGAGNSDGVAFGSRAVDGHAEGDRLLVVVADEAVAAPFVGGGTGGLQFKAAAGADFRSTADSHCGQCQHGDGVVHGLGTGQLVVLLITRDGQYIDAGGVAGDDGGVATIGEVVSIEVAADGSPFVVVGTVGGEGDRTVETDGVGSSGDRHVREIEHGEGDGVGLRAEAGALSGNHPVLTGFGDVADLSIHAVGECSTIFVPLIGVSETILSSSIESGEVGVAVSADFRGSAFNGDGELLGLCDGDRIISLTFVVIVNHQVVDTSGQIVAVFGGGIVFPNVGVRCDAAFYGNINATIVGTVASNICECVCNSQFFGFVDGEADGVHAVVGIHHSDDVFASSQVDVVNGTSVDGLVIPFVTVVGCTTGGGNLETTVGQTEAGDVSDGNLLNLERVGLAQVNRIFEYASVGIGDGDDVATGKEVVDVFIGAAVVVRTGPSVSVRSGAVGNGQVNVSVVAAVTADLHGVAGIDGDGSRFGQGEFHGVGAVVGIFHHNLVGTGFQVVADGVAAGGETGHFANPFVGVGVCAARHANADVTVVAAVAADVVGGVNRSHQFGRFGHGDIGVSFTAIGIFHGDVVSTGNQTQAVGRIVGIVDGCTGRTFPSVGVAIADGGSVWQWGAAGHVRQFDFTVGFTVAIYIRNDNAIFINDQLCGLFDGVRNRLVTTVGIIDGDGVDTFSFFLNGESVGEFIGSALGQELVEASGEHGATLCEDAEGTVVASVARDVVMAVFVDDQFGGFNQDGVTGNGTSVDVGNSYSKGCTRINRTAEVLVLGVGAAVVPFVGERCGTVDVGNHVTVFVCIASRVVYREGKSRQRVHHNGDVVGDLALLGVKQCAGGDDGVGVLTEGQVAASEYHVVSTSNSGEVVRSPCVLSGELAIGSRDSECVCSVGVSAEVVVSCAAGHGEGGSLVNLNGSGSAGTSTTCGGIGVGYGDTLVAIGSPLYLDAVRVVAADDGAVAHVPRVVGHVACGGEGDGVVGFRSIGTYVIGAVAIGRRSVDGRNGNGRVVHGDGTGDGLRITAVVVGSSSNGVVNVSCSSRSAGNHAICEGEAVIVVIIE